MANETKTVFVSGRIFWAKIIGKPRLNYDGDAREWSFEFEPDDVTFLKEAKLLDRLKDKNATDGRKEYLVLKKSEFNKAGESQEPIRIYDEDNIPWDGRLIGNGSGVDVKLQIVDYGKGKKAGIYTKAIRVTDHIVYESSEFSAMDEGAATKVKRPANKKAAELDDLDDEIPF